MRLIDADAMRIDFDKYVEHIRLIKKGRKQKTEIAILLDCKGAIDNAPTVDAIPIEWIEETMRLAESVGAKEYAEHLEVLLADWAEREEE